jgi:predicted dehydrogenase
MINIGLVGLGFMAATHIRAYRQVQGVRVAALCNPSGRHLDGDFTNVAGNVGATDPVVFDMAGVKATKNFAELLADPDLHAIDICAPTKAHEELAIAALRAGKHVLCEKPLARTSAAANRIVDAAAKAKGIFMPAMCLRFWPEWAWLKEAIAGGRYGRVLAARFRRAAEPPGWGQNTFFNGAESGGALFDLHVHDTDFVNYCFGRPRSVFSSGYQKFSGAIDHVMTQYDVPGGAIVHAEGCWAMTPGFGFNMSYTVNFERATADYDISRSKEALKVSDVGQPPRVVTVATDPSDGYVGELRHFVECILNGRAPSVVTAADGLASIEICEAEERSVNTRQIVTLKPTSTGNKLT